MTAPRILVLGAGGHAHVVVDALVRAGTTEIVGLLDDDRTLYGSHVVGVEVLGPLSDVARVAHDAVVVAIGDNASRRRIFSDLLGRGERFQSARHPSVVVGAEVEVGANVMMSAGVIVNVASAIGANVILNTGCTVDHHCQVGDHAHLGPGVHLGGSVRIGEGAFVGIGVVVLPGKRVGAWSTVGAGAVVTKDVPPGVTALGVPAAAVKIGAPVRL